MSPVNVAREEAKEEANEEANDEWGRASSVGKLAKRYAFPLSAIALLSTVALSQRFTRANRHATDSRKGIVAGAKPASSAPGLLTVSPVSAASAFAIPTPIKLPGSVTLFPSGLAGAYVGQDFAGKGCIVTFKRNAIGDWVSAGVSHSSNAGDYLGVAFSPVKERLYVWDRLTGRLLWAPYVEGNPPPKSWNTLSDSTQASELIRHVNGSMWLEEDGRAPKPVIFEYPPVYIGVLDSDLRVIRDDDSGAAISLVDGELDRAAYFDDQNDYGLIAGSQAVAIVGAPWTPVDILDVDVFSSPVRIGTAITDAFGNVSVPVSPLAFGHVYGVRSAKLSKIVGPYSCAVKKWGDADSLNSHTRIRRLPGLGMLAYVGHSHFRVPLRLDFDAQRQTSYPVSYAATLVVGYSTDPVIDIDPPKQRYVLLGSLGTFASSAQIFQAGWPGFGEVQLPIPNDPNLAGSEIRFQWWVNAGPSDLRISDVQGVPIRNAPWTPPGSKDLFKSAAAEKAKPGGGRSNGRFRINCGPHAHKAVATWIGRCKGYRSAFNWRDRLTMHKLRLMLSGSKRK